ncbi:MAG: CBS domain-containing protein [Nitrospiraceae bacterium]|nr:CBS domain-containing protein [Nitrospiraceae bacterium]
MNKSTIILTHSGADLDAISSMFAAGKLYPGAFLIHPGSLDTSAQKMLSLFGDTLNLVKVRELPSSIKQNIKRVIVVDTKIPRRTGNGKEFIDKNGIEVIVFDHHPISRYDIKNAKIVYRNYGANTTTLVELLKKKHVALTSVEATIIALGIYEDTGSFMFPSVTRNDFEAVAFLSLFGINMKIIRHFVSPFLNARQLALLDEFITKMEEYNINGIKVVITEGKVDKYIPGVSIVTHRLREMVDSDLLFVIMKTGKGTFIVGRSNSSEYNVKNILIEFGGGGHSTAATAYVEETDLNKITRMIRNAVQSAKFPLLKAENIMSFPVEMIDAKIGIKKAFKIMARMGFSGLPAVEKGKLLGIISKRDIEKIMLIEKRDRPVKQYLSPNAVLVKRDTDIREIEKLMVINNVGRVLVENNKKIVGIISRSDLLKAFYIKKYKNSAYEATGEILPSKNDVIKLLKNAFPPDIFNKFIMFGETARKTDQKIYIVGGAVRDIFLGKRSEDIDFVLDKNAIVFAKELSAKLKVPVRYNLEFGAAHLKYKGYGFDFSTTRREYYESPSALPKVENASLKEDLKRRDFTINTLSISIAKEDFGRLFDFFNGLDDLNKGIIRVIHPLSFIEDPSRLLRAIKYESKFGFKLCKDTEQLFINAVNLSTLKAKKSRRVIGELTELLSTEYAVSAIIKMAKRGILYEFFGIKQLSSRKKNTLIEAEKQIDKFNVNRLYVNLFLLMYGKNSKEIDERLDYLSVKRKIILNIISAEKTFKKISKQIGKIKKTDLFLALQKIDKPFIIGYIAMMEGAKKEELVNYVENLRRTNIEITGKELKALGLTEGKQFSEIFKTLTLLRIQGKINTKQEEINYILKNKKRYKFNE